MPLLNKVDSLVLSKRAPSKMEQGKRIPVHRMNNLRFFTIAEGIMLTEFSEKLVRIERFYFEKLLAAFRQLEVIGIKNDRHTGELY